MMDYGRKLEFGISFSPNAERAGLQLELTRIADMRGLDFVAIQDHPYSARFFDTFTLLSWLAAQTERVRFAPDVANLPLRGAAMLAKAAASLDVLTGGRFELAVGAGAMWDHIAGMGGPRRSPGEARRSTAEAIDVVRAFWSATPQVRIEGLHYSLHDVDPGPAPAHDIEIWVGAAGPRMLDLIGAKADGWLPSHFYVPPERLPAMQARIDAAASAAGREPAAIRRAYNVAGVIGAEGGDKGVAGPVATWVETLAGWATEQGIDTFIFWPAGDHARQVAIWADEVVPAVRAEMIARR